MLKKKMARQISEDKVPAHNAAQHTLQARIKKSKYL
jgi:hypothetical protein